MANEEILGASILVVCCFGCALLFFCIGAMADKSLKPINFWAGKNVGIEQVSDLRAYNHNCACMWKVYSVPYWISGLIACLGLFDDLFLILSLLFLTVACFPGILILIRRYMQIEKLYILR